MQLDSLFDDSVEAAGPNHEENHHPQSTTTRSPMPSGSGDQRLIPVGRVSVLLSTSKNGQGQAKTEAQSVNKKRCKNRRQGTGHVGMFQ